ncbi:unannotated protein [freshwater metagenome]|uniref:Unannotated protein n=1 Tax=freshwater metagenome TaxID=449393 RepID=A0A6J7EYR8_9ZZZZ
MPHEPEHEPETAGERPVHRQARMRSKTAEQCLCLVMAEHPAQHRCGPHGAEPELRCGHRVPRHPDQWSLREARQVVEVLEQWLHETAPPRAVTAGQRGHGVVERAVQHAGTLTAERVHQRHLGLHPAQAVLLKSERAECHRRCPSRVNGCADVVVHPGLDEFCRATAAADGGPCLIHRHLPALAGKARCGGQPVRAGTDDDCRSHRLTSPLRGARPRPGCHAMGDRGTSPPRLRLRTRPLPGWRTASRGSRDRQPPP